MNSLKIFAFTIALIFMACGGDTKPSDLFAIQIEGNKKNFQVNRTLPVSIENKKTKKIDGISYIIDGKSLSVENGQPVLAIDQLGTKILNVKVDYEGKSDTISREINVLAADAPEVYTYEIVNEYPHDMTAFTQGLEFHDGFLYESTGQKGTSSLRKVDFETGKILQQTELENTYFGEGITILGGNVYQLTWQGKLGFIYNLSDFKRKSSFSYGKSREGWGLCNDGHRIYKSDGTEKIWLLNPETMVEEGYIQTVTDKSIFNKANELEYVDGKIYANVWQKESMMIIDATSGAIEGVINFGGLKSMVKSHPGLDVLNGVAYHPDRKTFFVTGKRWDKLFEVRILKKS